VKGLLVVVIAALPMFLAMPPAHAQVQSGIQLENVGAEVSFGEQITFYATIKSATPIQEAMIQLLDESQGVIHAEPLMIGEGGRTEFHYDMSQVIVHPFSQVRWNYRFALPDGSTIQSEVFSTRYIDNRFDWQSLDSGSARVHWYEGGPGFGQAAQHAVQSSLDAVTRLIPVDLSRPVEIYIYSNMSDLRGTLLPGSQEWVAGHADPVHGIIMVAIEPGPGQDTFMQQRIPHELMHVMLSRAVGGEDQKLPVWLNEGMAGLAETVPNTEYASVLKLAIARDQWIALSVLCHSFPADTGRAVLAYAQAQSFISYLHGLYGSAGLAELANLYADGANCELGTELAFGVPLSKLEQDWHSSLAGQNPLLSALQNITPYLVLLIVILIVPILGMLSAGRRKGNPHGPETYIRK
jgi:hypothetical protein